MTLSDEIRDKLLIFQENEITEHHIYKRLAKSIKSPELDSVTLGHFAPNYMDSFS